MHEEAKKYIYHTEYQLIDSYTFPSDIEDWEACPICNSKPKVWIFNNGQQASCKCHNTQYDHFTIHAESIMSCLHNDGNLIKYHSHPLRKNWNHWCKTGEILFTKSRDDGRW